MPQSRKEKGMQTGKNCQNGQFAVQGLKKARKPAKTAEKDGLRLRIKPLNRVQIP